MFVVVLLQLGWTPAHFAVVGGHTATLKFLKEAGADMNAKNNVFHYYQLELLQLRFLYEYSSNICCCCFVAEGSDSC